MKRFALVALALVGCAAEQAPLPVPATAPPPMPVTAPPPVAVPHPGVPGMPGMVRPRPDPLPDGEPAAAIDSCGIARIRDLTGKPATVNLIQDAQTRAAVKSVRVIRPGTMVTMDFRPDRLNIDVDGRNMVVGLRCG